MPQASDAWQILLLLAAVVLLTLGIRQAVRQRHEPARTGATDDRWPLPWALVLGAVAMLAFVAVVAL